MKTELEQIQSLERFLDEQLEFAKGRDIALREKFPDEAKKVDNNLWFKEWLNTPLMIHNGIIEALNWMDNIVVKWDKDGKHTVAGFGFGARCNECENEDSKLCRKCRYSEENERESYFKTKLSDSEIWDESEM